MSMSCKQLIGISASLLVLLTTTSANPNARRGGALRLCAAAAAIIAVAALALLAMGRTPWYRSGPIKLWTSDAWGPENSQQLFDPYSFTHIIHGVLLYALIRLLAPRLSVGVRGVLAIAAESAWEIIENTDWVINRYRAATLALGYYGDSVLNSVGDILACAVGFVLAARLPTRMVVLATIGIELLLVLWIRDSLALNLLMLIHPVEAIKKWQLAP
jgi:hypothetical protein